MQTRTGGLFLAATLILMGCFTGVRAGAQQKLISVRTEEDVVDNSVVQPAVGTNKLVIAGPLVPYGTTRLPIVYSIRAELDGETNWVALVVALSADKPQIFGEVALEDGRRLPVTPYMQAEVQGKQSTSYRVRLSETYLQKAARTGTSWSFEGSHVKVSLKIPSYFFSGFVKKITATRAALKPEYPTNSLLYSGSIGNSKSPDPALTDGFGELTASLHVPLLFAPLSARGSVRGYGIKINDPQGKEMSSKELAGKEIELISLTKMAGGRTSFGAQLTGQAGLVIAMSESLLNPLQGLVPKAVVEGARSNLLGRTLWLRTDTMLTYDALKGEHQSHAAKRLQPINVEQVVLGDSANPIRLILRTESGEQFYQDYAWSKRARFEAGTKQFEALFYTEDPRKTFGWPEDVARLIEDSKIQFGMTREQVIAAWGDPDRKNTLSRRGGSHEQWSYRDRFIYFEDGNYVDYQGLNER